MAVVVKANGAILGSGYGAAVDACARAGRWEEALGLLEDPRSRCSQQLASLRRIWPWFKTTGLMLGQVTTHFSLFQWGLGCSLGVQGFDPWPSHRPCCERLRRILGRVSVSQCFSGMERLREGETCHPVISCPSHITDPERPRRYSALDQVAAQRHTSIPLLGSQVCPRICSLPL